MDNVEVNTKSELISQTNHLSAPNSRSSSRSSNHTISVKLSQPESSNRNNENKLKNQPALYQDPFYPYLGNKKLLEEQKEYFKDKGQISDKYLLP